MAAGVLSKPGSKHGPCKKAPCKHTDCAYTRTIAGKSCRICTKPIGYGARFYQESSGLSVAESAFVHAVCAEVEAERNRPC
jgi:hypothetical protein